MAVVSEAKPRKTSTKAPTIGSIIDQLWTAREKKRDIAKQDAAVAAEIEVLEGQLYERMDNEGTTKSAGARASVSLGTTDVVQLDGDAGFELFTKYIKKTGYFHLLERRVAQLGAKEILATKGKIPGCKVFTKRKITLTTTPSK